MLLPIWKFVSDCFFPYMWFLSGWEWTVTNLMAFDIHKIFGSYSLSWLIATFLCVICFFVVMVIVENERDGEGRADGFMSASASLCGLSSLLALFSRDWESAVASFLLSVAGIGIFIVVVGVGPSIPRLSTADYILSATAVIALLRWALSFQNGWWWIGTICHLLVLVTAFAKTHNMVIASLVSILLLAVTIAYSRATLEPMVAIGFAWIAILLPAL